MNMRTKNRTTIIHTKIHEKTLLKKHKKIKKKREKNSYFANFWNHGSQHV